MRSQLMKKTEENKYFQEVIMKTEEEIAEARR